MAVPLLLPVVKGQRGLSVPRVTPTPWSRSLSGGSRQRRRPPIAPARTAPNGAAAVGHTGAVPDESMDDRLTPQALLAHTAQGDFDPRQSVRVGQLDAVVDADVELFQLTMGPDDVEEQKTALIGILLTLRPRLIRGIRETPEELRQSAGPRPRARIKVTCPVFEGGRAIVQMTRIEGPADDVKLTEGLQLEERVKRLLAACVLEELNAL